LVPDVSLQDTRKHRVLRDAISTGIKMRAAAIYWPDNKEMERLFHT